MEPPGGLPPDRDRQLVLRPPQQQQQLVPLVPQAKPTLALNLYTKDQAASSTIATTPADDAIVAAASTENATASSSSTSIRTTNALVLVSTSNVVSVIAAGSSSTATSTSPALASAAIAISGTTQAATAFSGSAVGVQHTPHHLPPHHHPHHPPHQMHHQPYGAHNSSTSSSLLGGISASTSSSTSVGGQQQTIEKLARPMAFDKMEALVRTMQNDEKPVPVRVQKTFLSNIPSAFMGYDLIEWMMDRLIIEESEALSIANQLCLHGYFFPVNDTKTLAVKDDSSLYRFQTPYYWPWQHKPPDNVEYAIYLAKRSLRNKQRHALEEYETEALASLHKSLKGKWDFITMQAEEQVRLAKERKKGDKIVVDSQERAYWRVHRPPPGQFTPLEPCPIPSRDRQGFKPNKKKTVEDVQREVDYLRKSLNRTRMKMSQACESLVAYSETFAEYDFFLQPVLPSNPWVTEDTTFWQLNNSFVETPTEKRVKRWAISIEELVSDPTGLQEFTSFLEKEYSHENIRFWIAVNRLRRSAHSQVPRKVKEIYEEFLKPGAPCEINIDGKTMESVLKGLKNPSRFTFDSASEHIYTLLLKKDCYPRFIRSDHYKRLLEAGVPPSHKKRFFNFGGVSSAKKKMTAALSSQPNLGEGTSAKNISGASGSMMTAPPPGNLARRRGSDRSLTGSAHELAVIGVNKDVTSKVPHSHSQSNLSEMPYSSESIYRGDMPQLQVTDVAVQNATLGNRESSSRSLQETTKPKAARLETTVESSSSAVCPWDVPDEPPDIQAPTPLQKSQIKLSICPWEQEGDPAPVAVNTAKSATHRLTSTSSDITDVSDRIQRNLGIRHQNTVDSGEASKRLVPNFTEQRRASMSFTQSRLSEYQFGQTSVSAKTSSSPSPTVGSQSVVGSVLPAPPPPLFTQSIATIAAVTAISSSSAIVTKDPPSSSDAEVEDELNKLAISQRNSESSASEMCALPPPTPTPPPITKVTPPPPDENICPYYQTVEVISCESSQSDLVCGAERSGGSGNSDNGSIVLSETEIEIPVQEVQIELVESYDFQEGKSPQLSTPSIHVEEEMDDVPIRDSEQSPAEDYATEAVTPRTPITSRGNSRPETPEMEQTLLPAATTPDILQSPQLRTSTSSGALLVTASVIPPPPPAIGPMEEEEQLRVEEEIAAAQETQEELSPTTDEYQEGLQFDTDGKEDYEYDIVDTDTQAGYIPPAPTPAPSMAPLAEMDIDTVDDEPCEEPCSMQEFHELPEIPTTPTPAVNMYEVPPTIIESVIPVVTEEVKKRRKKRSAEGKKILSVDEKEQKASTSAGGAGEVVSGAKSETDRNTVCPWEDENVTTSDGTFVKTYATLGYL
uniref:Regulator of G-protein signaling 7 n=1 Tax=Zeugodacus cucurbitae TaxID=28588 RepID=A0A0A1WP13_ZEUCU